MYEYYSNIIYDVYKLQSTLSDMGRDGWRLHTCDRFSDGNVDAFFVVMDRFVQMEQNPDIDNTDEAIAVRG